LKRVKRCFVLAACLISLLGTAAKSDEHVIIISADRGRLADSARSSLLEAGAVPLQKLSLTKSEVWSVPRERLRSLRSMLPDVALIQMEEDGYAAALATTHDGMDARQNSMLSDAKSSQAMVNWCVVTLPHPAIMEYLLTRSEGSRSDARNLKLEIDLRKDLRVSARVRTVRAIEGGYAWHGIIDNTGEPITLIWRQPAELSGQIVYRKHQYVIRHLGKDKFAIVEIDPKMMPQDHPAKRKAGMPATEKSDIKKEIDGSEFRRRSSEPLKNLRDAYSGGSKTELAFVVPPPSPRAKRRSQSIIDVLVPYTAKAAAHYVDIKTELIDLAIEDANQSFVNSGVENVRLRLVHAYQTDYAESGTHFDHVFRLADKGDGYMEEVHALRDKYHADVVVLIVDDPNGCGLAAGVAPGPDRAFAAVHRECAATTYSLAHEIGHILGARHEVAYDDTAEPFSYGHGFVFGTKWRTIMSYGDDCGGCPRLPIWSSSRVKVGGVPAGDLLADNARVIEKTAARIAGYR
jgi:hypothetical protein